MLRRLIWLGKTAFRRSRFDRKMDEELRFHIEERTNHWVREGLPRKEAMRRARLEFGGLEAYKEECREIRGGRWLGAFWQDLRFGVRTMAKGRSFTLVAVASLAIGIGANTAIFSAINAVILRDIPYADPERLVRIFEVPPNQPEGRRGAAVGNLIAWQENQQVFEWIGGAQLRTVNASDEDAPEFLRGQRATLGFLEALGVEPRLGRGFVAEDFEAGPPWPVILGDGFWQRRFSGDPDVIGSTITLDSVDHTIIGVMPPGFQAPLGSFATDDLQFWTPFRVVEYNLLSKTRYVNVIARLKPGLTIQQAQSQIDALALDMQRWYPDRNEGWGIALTPLQEVLSSRGREALLILAAAAGLVLLVACANVAGLLLGRSAARQHEIAIRASLGAGRLRIVRQLLTESVLLAVCGGAFGVLFAYASLRALLSLAPPYIFRLEEASIEPGVLGFTLALSIITGVVFGLAPIIHMAEPRLGEVIKGAGRGGGSGRDSLRLRKALVVTEVALALVLVICSGLLVNSFVKLAGVDAGFETKNLLAFVVRLPHPAYLTPHTGESGYHMSEVDPRVAPIFAQVLERIRTLPGLESAAMADAAPLADWNQQQVRIASRGESDRPSDRPRAGWHAVSEGFFSTVGVPLVQGRGIRDSDGYESPWVAVVNREAVRRYWPDSDPIGDEILRVREGETEERPRRVVGVVGDIRHSALDEPMKPEIYISHMQRPLFTRAAGVGRQMQRTFLVRTPVSPETFLPAVQRIVSELTSGQPVSDVRRVEEFHGDQLRSWGFAATLLSIFGGVSIFLAAVGLFGLMAYSVVLRTKEIGLRMALGAQGKNIVGMLLRQGVLLGGLGIAIGTAISLGVTRILTGYLYGVTPTDPGTFLMVGLILLAVVLAACFVPARRAAGVDPMTSLRCE